jgi:hypothetical protein
VQRTAERSDEQQSRGASVHVPVVGPVLALRLHWREVLDVPDERGPDHLRQLDRAAARLRLEFTEVGRPAHESLELTMAPHLPAGAVDVVNLQPEDRTAR